MNAIQSGLHNVSILKPDTVNNDIKTFLKNKRKRSASTAEAYERDIRLFFKSLRNKDIESLEKEDVKITLPMLMEYQTLLIDSGLYKNTSINRMIASVESLYGYFKASEYEVNPFIFKKIEGLPDDTVNTGIISPDEAKKIAQLALLEKHNGAEKRTLIMLAASTSIRKDAILKIHYSDITPHESKTGVYIINSDELFDKGKMVAKEIHEDMYQMLLDLKSEKQVGDLIFTLSYGGLNDMIKRLCKNAGLDPRRKLSFHSLRKTGVMFTDEVTNGDLIAITAQGGWSSPEVAYNSYIGKQRKVNLAGVGMFEDIDEEVFDELSREELIELLKSFGNGIGIQLRRKAQEIIDNRERG